MKMYPLTIWRPEKVVVFRLSNIIGNVRTTGQCSIWTNIQQAIITSFVGTFF